jgi:Cu-Zn family superoxide dismutase
LRFNQLGGIAMKLHVLYTAAALAVSLLAVAAHADQVVVTMNKIDSTGMGETIGTITASSSPYGTIFTPDLHGLSPGLHGFHVHEKPDCGPAMKDGKPVAGLAAGGHYDPAGTGRHEGPYGNGHLGDLPPLYVGPDGTATQPVLAPRLKLSDLKGRSLMIHAGGDNYSDKPEPLGGGGARVACGVVK